MEEVLYFILGLGIFYLFGWVLWKAILFIEEVEYIRVSVAAEFEQMDNKEKTTEDE